MAGLTHHLARRAVEGYAAARTMRMPPRVEAAIKDIDNFTVPAWFPVVAGFTFLAFVVTLVAIDYSLGEVVATLLMVESPTREVADAPPQYEDIDESDAPLLSETQKLDSKVEPELLPTKEAAPITSSIRGTFRHLRSRGGRLAKFRGFRLNIIAGVLLAHLTGFIMSMFPRGEAAAPFLAPVLATIILTPLLMTLTHVVISEPSPKYWFRRIPKLKTCMKAVPATAVLALSSQVVIFLPTTLMMAFGFQHVGMQLSTMSDGKEAQEMVGVKLMQAIVVLAVTIFSYVMVLVPANVALTRVQASLLPETDETIVPMDRSFGGKFTSESVGGTGKLGVVDAWRTFGWSARVRLLKLIAKMFMVQTALTFVFLTILAFEAGIAFRPIMCKSHMVVRAFMRGQIQQGPA